MDYNALIEALARHHGTPTAAARAVGVSQPAYLKWLQGAKPKDDSKEKITEAAIRAGLLNNSSDLHIVQNGKISNVRELDSRLGAGGGGVAVIESKFSDGDFISSDAFRPDTWGMPASFLESELKVNPRQAIIAEVVGDSGYDPATPNSPGSLLPGDRVIIDTQDQLPSPPGPFAVFDGMGLVIKIVESVPRTSPPRIRLSSRNPAYSPYEVTLEEAHIIGRIKGRISRM